MEVKIGKKYFHKDKGMGLTDGAGQKLTAIKPGATPSQDILTLEPEWGRKPGKEKNHSYTVTREVFLQEFTTVSLQEQRTPVEAPKVESKIKEVTKAVEAPKE